MRALRLEKRCRSTCARRAAVSAVLEVLLLLIVFPALCLMGINWMVTATNESTSSARQSMCGICRISLDDDGQRLFVYRRCHDVTQRNLATDEVERSLPHCGIELLAVSHSRDHLTSLLCAMDGSIALICDGEHAGVARAQSVENVLDCAVSGTGTVSIFATASAHFRGWRRNGLELIELGYSLSPTPAVVRIGLDRTGARLCVARCDGTVSFHDPDTGASDGPVVEFGEHCTGFAWSENERMLVAVTIACKIRAYDLVNHRFAFEDSCTIATGNSPQTALEISPDGKWVAVAFVGSHEINVWDIQAGKLAGRLCGHSGNARSMQFSPNSPRLYSGAFDGTIREWSLETFTQLRLIE